MGTPPKLELVEGSEIWADIDTSGIYLDGKCRPIFISNEFPGDSCAMEITVEDARRLLHFLQNAIFFLEVPKPTLVPTQ